MMGSTFSRQTQARRSCRLAVTVMTVFLCASLHAVCNQLQRTNENSKSKSSETIRCTEYVFLPVALKRVPSLQLLSMIGAEERSSPEALARPSHSP